jgi:hypothetical protein
MPWPFAPLLDILEGVGIRSMVVFKMRAADGLVAGQSLLLANIQRKLAPSSLGMRLDPLAISFCGFTGVLRLLFVVDTLVYYSVCPT